MDDKPYLQIIKANLFAVQVCVPKETTDDEIVAFVESELPSDLEDSPLEWHICKEGAQQLGGDPARVPCDQNPETRVHIVVEC